MEMNWKNPPKDPPNQAKLVGDALRENPGEWALIAENDTSTFFPWWAPLYNSGEFETKIKRVPGSPLFGPHDVYSRYIGPEARRGTRAWDDEARDHGK